MLKLEVYICEAFLFVKDPLLWWTFSKQCNVLEEDFNNLCVVFQPLQESNVTLAKLRSLGQIRSTNLFSKSDLNVKYTGASGAHRIGSRG